jgi:hypothetical protein
MSARLTRCSPLRACRAGIAALVVLSAHVQAQEARPGDVTRPPVRIAPRSLWLFGVTAEQGWDSNVQFQQGDDRDLINRYTGFLTLIRARERSRVSLTGSGGASLFQRRTQFDNFSGNLALEGTRRLSPRALGTAGVFFQRRLSNDVFGGIGLPLISLSMQESYGGSAALLHRFTPRTSGRVDVNYAAVTFDQATLIPGNVASLRAQLTHLYRRGGSVLLSAEGQEGNALGNPLSLQTVSAGWQPEIGQVQARFIFGATRIATGAIASYLPSGIVELSDSLGSGVLRGAYSRGASQAFGLGRFLVNDAGSLAYDFQARRGNLLTFSAATANSRESGGAGIPFRSQSVTAAYRRIWENGITLGLGASYRSRDDFLRASAVAGNLSVGYALRSR